MRCDQGRKLSSKILFKNWRARSESAFCLEAHLGPLEGNVILPAVSYWEGERRTSTPGGFILFIRYIKVKDGVRVRLQEEKGDGGKIYRCQTDTLRLLSCRIVEQIPVQGRNPLCLRENNAHANSGFSSVQRCNSGIVLKQKCTVLSAQVLVLQEILNIFVGL